ncbi:hypothetical protein D1B31_16905 [Neobacillus notoginsengisoli]|uniref:Uncharacterized protein n=1 Tax=Neobacillus notoginsengisoli TaxID=1578198 RepID=A0A417YQ74_9BACI|nr:hypothetical protein [Neobacillus notoginsengisoli]RHW36397.1 hypothetical protein D1B31_16905 [Neobacillus notoginsengisoli]
MIEAEGTASSKMLSHFLRAMIIRRGGFVLRDAAARWRPHRRYSAEEAPLTPRGKRVPAAEIIVKT